MILPTRNSKGGIQNEKIEFNSSGNLTEQTMIGDGVSSAAKAVFGPDTRYIIGKMSNGKEVMVLTREFACVDIDECECDIGEVILEDCDADDRQCFGMVFVDGRITRTFITDIELTSSIEKVADIYEEVDPNSKIHLKIDWNAGGLVDHLVDITL